MKKDVLVVLVDRWADWEVSHTLAGIHPSSMYQVKTLSYDNQPKETIGGVKSNIDITIKEYNDFDNCAMVILAGGFGWKEIGDEIAEFIEKVSSYTIPVAAICGATIYLAKYGFLNEVKHTGDVIDCFIPYSNYRGKTNFLEKQVVVDKQWITANETAAIPFAYEIFKMLKVYPEEDIEQWYKYYKNGLFQS